MRLSCQYSFTKNKVHRITKTENRFINIDRTYNFDNISAPGTAGSLPALSFNYAYDANKNVTSESITSSPPMAMGWTATFDAEDRLNTWNRDDSTTRDYNLDLIGNWDSVTRNGITENRSHNSVHELTTMGANSLTYDVKGNLTSKTSSNSPLQALTWDIDNHLKTASVDNINFANYEYDALGRRVAKTLANGDKTVYVLCGQKVCAEYTNGSISNKYVWGTYVDDLIAQVDGATTLYAHSDRQYIENLNAIGSSLVERPNEVTESGLTDSNGNVVELNGYTPYGTKETFDATGAPLASSATVYGFTGRRLDNETGLWYFRARYYDAEMGRFISRDPLMLCGWSFGLIPWIFCTRMFHIRPEW